MRTTGRECSRTGNIVILVFTGHGLRRMSRYHVGHVCVCVYVWLWIQSRGGCLIIWRHHVGHARVLGCGCSRTGTLCRACPNSSEFPGTAICGAWAKANGKLVCGIDSTGPTAVPTWGSNWAYQRRLNVVQGCHWYTTKRRQSSLPSQKSAKVTSSPFSRNPREFLDSQLTSPLAWWFGWAYSS